MEIWDAYNQDFQKIDGIELIRGNPIPEGYYHLVCDVLVKHQSGLYLLMQRDYRKHLGGLWEASAGGSALKGESPLDCALREVSEETGIQEIELHELGRIVNSKTKSIYVEYLGITNCKLDSIILQQGETINYQWVKNIDPTQLASSRIFKLYKE